jgi:RND superfamily putative drug exporter
MLALAVPSVRLRLGFVDAGTDPAGQTTRRAYDLVARGFGPGANGPFLLAADLHDATEPALALQRLGSQLHADPSVAAVSTPTLNADRSAAVVELTPRGRPQAAETSALLHRIRSTIVPEATAGTGARIYVGGPAATNDDFSHRVGQSLPWFIGVVVGLSFLLLLVAFRSVVVPLKAAVMNLLSLGAAYGVVVAVFEWGWGRNLLGLRTSIPIQSFVPLMMFALLFGLSMDYEVFLLSRIREAWLRTGDNAEAVSEGLGSTARVITAAAAIMVVFFLSFVLGNNPIIKLFGLGLASAILVDATIIRLLLVPSTMELLGDRNWWLPSWLERAVPRVDVEGHSPLAPDDRVAAQAIELDMTTIGPGAQPDGADLAEARDRAGDGDGRVRVDTAPATRERGGDHDHDHRSQRARRSVHVAPEESNAP